MTSASFWIGNGPDRVAFYSLLEYHISDGGVGDFVPCPFCRVIGVQAYDDDFLEGEFLPKKVERLELIFRGHPMLSQLEKAWPQPAPSNCGVVLHDCAVMSPDTFEIDGFSFKFLGNFTAA